MGNSEVGHMNLGAGRVVYQDISRIADAIRAETEAEREEALFDSDHKMLWYKMSVGSGGLLAQSFECMRVCPIATQAPLADPVRRFEAAREVDP